MLILILVSVSENPMMCTNKARIFFLIHGTKSTSYFFKIFITQFCYLILLVVLKNPLFRVFF